MPAVPAAWKVEAEGLPELTSLGQFSDALFPKVNLNIVNEIKDLSSATLHTRCLPSRPC